MCGLRPHLSRGMVFNIEPARKIEDEMSESGSDMLLITETGYENLEFLCR